MKSNLLPTTPRDWVHIAVFGVVIFLLSLAVNIPAAGALGVGFVVLGLVGWWATAMVAERRARR